MEPLTIGKAARQLGVHPNSLCNWEKRGLVKPLRLPNGQRRYSMDQLSRLLLSDQVSDEPEAVVLYVRISAEKHADAGNLKRQMDRLRQYAHEHGLTIKTELTDVASALNQNRRGLGFVLRLAE